MGRLKDKVAVVTGSGRIGNIGVAVCDAYLREGCAGVIATDISTTEASSVVEMMENITAVAASNLYSMMLRVKCPGKG